MIDDILHYFVIGFSLTVGGLCGIAIMSILYHMMDAFGIKLKDKNND
jgi:hypothetical protein